MSRLATCCPNAGDGATAALRPPAYSPSEPSSAAPGPNHVLPRGGCPAGPAEGVWIPSEGSGVSIRVGPQEAARLGRRVEIMASASTATLHLYLRKERVRVLPATAVAVASDSSEQTGRAFLLAAPAQFMWAR